MESQRSAANSLRGASHYLRVEAAKAPSASPPPPRKLSSIRFLFLFSRENEWTPVALNDARIGKFHIYNRRRAADERVNFVHPVVSLDMRRLGGLCAL